MKFKLCLFAYLLTLNAFVHSASCPEQWHPFINSPAPKPSLKCIRYFDNPVNFSEAQYVCNEIYDGDLLSVNSPLEQKLLVQYLHGLLGFKRQPVCWLGGTFTQNPRTTTNALMTLSNQLKWLDGTTSQYHNFAFDPSNVAQSTSERKCIKILSLIAKGEQGAPGMWAAEDCKLRDAGFVCQKKILVKGSNSILNSELDRSRTANGPSAATTDSTGDTSANALLAQFGEQLNAIKELCESQIKAIERLSSNFLFILQNFDEKRKKDEL